MGYSRVTGIVCALCCICLSTVSAGDVTVHTSLGDIVGAVSVNQLTFSGTLLNFTTFLGIPFAEPAIGDLRFHKPVTKDPFTESFIAKTPGDACLQITGNTGSKTFSEDCLNLNIFLPGTQIDTANPKAVMIWIYGGGFSSGYQDLYFSPTFAALNDVILVTFNYRLHVFGFLSTGENDISGNYGLWDQHMAIRWVHDHITAFGGDVNRVTIFGESAGAASAVYQAMFEGDIDLFQRVIAQSGTANCPWALQKNPSKFYSDFANVTGCASQNNMSVIQCMRNLTTAEIHDKAGELLDNFFPTLDEEFITLPPKDVVANTSTTAAEINARVSKLDFIFGTVSNEAGMYYFIHPTGLGVVVSQYGGNITEGVSRHVLERLAPDFVNRFMGADVDEDLVATAINNQYIDWADPDNLVKNRQRLHDVAGDFMFYAGIVSTANAHSENGGHESGSLYMYRFDHRPSWSQLPTWFTGASHADEVDFVFGHHYFVQSMADPADVLSSLEIELSHSVMRYWTNFAKTGNPNVAGSGPADGLPTWPAYDSRQQYYILINDDVAAFPTKTRPSAVGAHFFNHAFPRLTSRCQATSCQPCDNDVNAGAHLSTGVFPALIIVSLIQFL